MTPAARVQAAIDVLGMIDIGQPAEKALTRWARQSRFAGSKDRAAVRDHVFGVLRRKRSAALLGGGSSARALMLGALRADGVDPRTLFSGEGYGPAALSDTECTFVPPAPDRNTCWNLPDWLCDAFARDLGPAAAEQTALMLQGRGPVCLRVNRRRGTVPDARAALAAETIATDLVEGCPQALIVTEGARALRNSRVWAQGLVELQDAHSQAVALAVPEGARMLDFCAGGGGKALVLADVFDGEVYAHDADPARMRDLPARMERAGVLIHDVAGEAVHDNAPYGTVLCDAPCSGSGSWRRSPEAKWALTPDALADLCATQDAILHQASALVSPEGTLVYATCSVLACENEERIAAFLRDNPAWFCISQSRYPVTATADGFYSSHMKRY